MREVEDPLVVRVRVDRRHEAALDPHASWSTLATGATQFVVQEAFEMMRWLLAVVGVVVHAEDERHVRIGRGRRDEDLLGAGVEVRLRLSRFVKRPVDSSATWTPRSSHGSAAGSRSSGA